MRRRLVYLLLVSLTLLAACRPAKVTSYRVPKEKPEEMPPGMAAASTNAGTVPHAGGPAAPAVPGAPALPAAPGGDMASTPVPTATGADLTWTAPANWAPKPLGQMRKGSYAVPGPDGDADLSITAFPGDVGGELANLNRWRGQIQLPPLGENDLAGAAVRFKQDGLDYVVVDFVSPSTNKPARIVGAIVPYMGATWFFKLMGPAPTVEAAKPAFMDFLKSVHPTAIP